MLAAFVLLVMIVSLARVPACLQENVEWQNTRNKKTFDDLKKELE